MSCEEELLASLTISPIDALYSLIAASISVAGTIVLLLNLWSPLPEAALSLGNLLLIKSTIWRTVFCFSLSGIGFVLFITFAVAAKAWLIVLFSSRFNASYQFLSFPIATVAALTSLALGVKDLDSTTVTPLPTGSHCLLTIL